MTICQIVTLQGNLVESREWEGRENVPLVFVRKGHIYEAVSGTTKTNGDIIHKYRLVKESSIARIW